MSPETQKALIQLKRALQNEPYMLHAQVTFDNIASMDEPPTVDGIFGFPRTEIENRDIDSFRAQFIHGEVTFGFSPG